MRTSSASQLDDLEAFLEDALGELRAAQRARAGIEEHVLADEAFGAADRHLERRRARLAADVRHPHPVGADLLEPRRGEVDHDVGRDVVGRVVHLVEQLLLDRLQVDGAAGAGDLGDARRCRRPPPRRSGKPRFHGSGTSLKPGSAK